MNALVSADPLREKLLGLLSAGVGQGPAALAVGISDGYLSQLMKDPDFVAALAVRSSVRVEKALKHDDKIESLEDKVLGVLESKLPFVRNPLEAVRIFQALNAAKKRAQVGAGNGNEILGAQQVAIVLPKAAAVHITVNSLNQVIGVDGGTMATLPSRSLPELAAKMKKRQQEEEAVRAQELLALTGSPVTFMNGVARVL